MAKIWLIGMMGSGKTTVAPLVASRLGWRVLDTDAVIAAESGRPATDWLPADWAEFRVAERAVVASAAADPEDLVVACGGGVVLDPESVALMRAGGMVFCLEAPQRALEARVGSGSGRPLLAGDAVGALDAILRERIDLYRGAAHLVVSAGEAPEAVAEAVVAAWRNSS